MFKKKPVEKGHIISHNEVNVDDVFKTNRKWQRSHVPQAISDSVFCFDFFITPLISL